MSTEAEQTKIHDAKKARQSAKAVARLKQVTALLLLSVCMLVAALLLAYYIADMANDVLALNKPDRPVTLTLAKGTTPRELTEQLQANGIVKYKTLFYLFLQFTYKEDGFTEETLTLNTNMSYQTLMRKLRP